MQRAVVHRSEPPPTVLLALVLPGDLTPLQRSILRALPDDRATAVACFDHRGGCRQLASLGLVTLLSPGSTSTIVALTDLGRRVRRDM